ncbi:MAG: hypothetical protein JSW29_05525 [Candidatus Bathyarchaeota archaeon]|nr:MAG: hypothetical protein JSW29_05525 [Candidatus Bathyarchaeota archaeon]
MENRGVCASSGFPSLKTDAHSLGTDTIGLLDKKTGKMKERDEPINTPEELEEATKRFLEKVRKLREDESKRVFSIC